MSLPCPREMSLWIFVLALDSVKFCFQIPCQLDYLVTLHLAFMIILSGSNYGRVWLVDLNQKMWSSLFRVCRCDCWS
ncbi:hypothetical protein AMECASPLE_036906 [Ameca splendens]|uniref:Uncharacterized protein n=1 Tax=Ameca splendens TaxID=208324 RepID=A0ABV0YVF4_9TELE